MRLTRTRNMLNIISDTSKHIKKLLTSMLLNPTNDMIYLLILDFDTSSCISIADQWILKLGYSKKIDKIGVGILVS